MTEAATRAETSAAQSGGQCDVFVSYAGADNIPSFVASTLLPKKKSDTPNCMDYRSLFFDQQKLKSHVQWVEELKLRAEQCQVIIAVVGRHWANTIVERRTANWGLPGSDDDAAGVDWVLAELNWALNRESPAHLIVCYWGSATPVIDLNEVFPSDIASLAAVRAAFENECNHQHLKYSSSDDDQALIDAVDRGFRSFESRTTVPTSPVAAADHALSERTAAPSSNVHWLRFLNRKDQWAEIAQVLDAPVIGAKRFPPVPSTDSANSAAFLWGIEHDDDECQEFAIAINHHLFAKGELVQKLGDAGSTDVESMTVVAGDRAVDVLASIFEKMTGAILPESVSPKCGQDVLQAQVVQPLKSAVMTFDELPHCVYAYAQVDSSAASAVLLEELKLFCALWNRCDWTPLNGRRLAVVVFVKCKHDKPKWWQFSKRSEMSLPETSIGEIDANCIDTWRKFMQHKLKLSDQLGPLFDALTPERFDKPIRYKALKQKLNKEDDS